jgi:hypothetical protein
MTNLILFYCCCKNQLLLMPLGTLGSMGTHVGAVMRSPPIVQHHPSLVMGILTSFQDVFQANLTWVFFENLQLVL